MLASLIEQWGYIIVFLGALIEGEVIILISCSLAARGLMNIYTIFFIVILCSILVDQILFLIGRKYGENIIHKFFSTKMINITKRFLHIAKKYETSYTLAFRFIPGMRTVSPIILGTIHVEKRKFFILNIIAALLWASVICSCGYKLGDKYNGITLFAVLACTICTLMIIKGMIIKIITHVTTSKSDNQ